MPLGCDTATTNTSTVNMAIQSDRSSFHTIANQEQSHISSSSSNLDLESDFDETRCLFCKQESSDLSQNILHMSKIHGLHITQANLLVDEATLLAYFNFVISECRECLYCGLQRHTRQAVQQHMMAKGHCKYDMQNSNAEIREFYDFSSSNEEEHINRLAMRLADDSQLAQGKLRKQRPSRRSESHSPDITISGLEQAQSTPVRTMYTDQESNSSNAETPTHSQIELSTRALKQEHTLNNQLSQLRAGDRRSLVHLPASQQRALLVTHHKQLEKARRTEQTQRGNLESSGNKVNCLDKIRLIRKPPHTGNVFSLNR